MIPTIAIVNESDVTNDADISSIAAALQIQVSRDFAPIWGTDAKVQVWSKNQTVPKGVWEVVILNDADQAGALGYHELTVNGDPLAKVFARTDQMFGSALSVTVSHELLEMLGDPDINQSIQNDDKDGIIRFFAYEVCDACEDDQFAYTIDAGGKTTLVSDFVTPDWFFGECPRPGPYDFKGHITKPLQLLPNGYIGVFDVDGGHWTQLNGRMESASHANRAVPQPHNRRFRRAMGRAIWANSLK